MKREVGKKRRGRLNKSGLVMKTQSGLKREKGGEVGSRKKENTDYSLTQCALIGTPACHIIGKEEEADRGKV